MFFKQDKGNWGTTSVSPRRDGVSGGEKEDVLKRCIINVGTHK